MPNIKLKLFSFLNRQHKEYAKLNLYEILRIINKTPVSNIESGGNINWYPFSGEQYGFNQCLGVREEIHTEPYKSFAKKIIELTNGINTLRNEGKVNHPRIIASFYRHIKRKGYSVMECAQGVRFREAIINGYLNSSCSQEHLNEFVRQWLEVVLRGVKLDCVNMKNFFYDHDIGFSFIDIDMSRMHAKRELKADEKEHIESNITLCFLQLFDCKSLYDSKGFMLKLAKALIINDIGDALENSPRWSPFFKDEDFIMKIKKIKSNAKLSIAKTPVVIKRTHDKTSKRTSAKSLHHCEEPAYGK